MKKFKNITHFNKLSPVKEKSPGRKPSLKPTLCIYFMVLKKGKD